MARPDQTQQWPGGRDFSGRDGHGSSSHRGGYTGGRTGGWGNHPPLHSVMQPPQPPPSRWSSHTPGRITTDAYAPTTESDAVLSRPAPQSQPPSTSEGWDADHKAVHGWERMTRTIAHYRRIEQIGEGTYGQVYRAQCLDTGRIVAMKKIRLHHGGYWGMPPTVIREIKILKRLRHPCMVEMLEVVSSKGVEHLDEEDEREDDRRRRRKEQADKDAMNISPNNTSDIASNIKKDVVSSSKKKGNSKADRVVDAREGYKGNLFLVLEYVSHDLTGLMDMAYRFTEVQAKCIFRQLLDVLAYMHEAKYVHRDIKSSNILIDSHFRVKLADFGLARCIEPPILDNANDRSSGQSQSGGQDFTNKVITLWYRPPELLLGATRYGSQVDVWSAGCILYELLLGKPLFAGKTEMEQLRLIFELIGTPTETSWEGFTDLKLIRTKEVVIEKRRKPKLRAKYGTKITGPAMNLLEKLLELDPSKRLTASRALESRYFLSEPRAPDQPEQLGSIVLGDGNEGNFHEFQTKKRRREAKVIAEKAKEEARARGEDETGVTAAYDEAYRHHMKGAAAEKAAEIAAKAEKDLREAEALKLQEKERISPSRKRTNERDMMVEGDDYRKSEKEDERSHRSRDKKDRKRHRSDVDDRKRHRDSSSKADHRSSSSSKRERRDEDRKRSSRDRDRHHRHHHRGTKEDDGERSTERSSSRHHKHDIVEEVVDTKKEKPDEIKTEKPEPKTMMEIDVPASKDVKDLSKTATEPLKTDHLDGYKTAENAQKNDDTLDKPPGGREDSKNASKSDVDKEKSEKPRSSDSRRHTNGSSSRSSKHRSGSHERGSTSDRRSSRDDRGRDHGGRSGTMMEQPPRGPSSHPQGRDPSMLEDRRGWERGPDSRSRTNFDSRGADRGRESWRDEPSNGDHAGMGDRGPQPRHQSHPGDFDRDRRRPDHARQAGGGPPPDQSWGGGHFGGGRGPGAPPSQQWRGPGPRGSRDGGRGGFRGDSRPGGDRQGDRFGGRSGGGHHRDR